MAPDVDADRARAAEVHDERGATHRGLAAFAGVVALSAIGGAVGLVTGSLSLTPTIEARLPFASPVLGGLALAAIVALPMAVTAALAWTGDARAGRAAVVAGGLQIGWIVVQVAFIRVLTPFHPTFLLVGIALIWLGRRIDRP